MDKRPGDWFKYPITNAGRRVPALVMDVGYSRDSIPCVKVHVMSEKKATKLGWPNELSSGERLYDEFTRLFRVRR